MDPHCIWFNKKLISWSGLRCDDDTADSGKKKWKSRTQRLEVVAPEVIDKPTKKKKRMVQKHETAGNCYLAYQTWDETLNKTKPLSAETSGTVHKYAQVAWLP